MNLKDIFKRASDYIRFGGHGPQGYIKIQTAFAKNPNIRILKELSDHGVTTADGMTPFLSAASFGNLTVMKAMLEHGVDINQTLGGQKEGASALTLAVVKGDIEPVRYLLSKNADVTVGRDVFGHDALASAKFHDRSEIAAMIEDAIAKKNKPQGPKSQI